MEDKPLKSLECQVKSLHFFFLKENFPSDPPRLGLHALIAEDPGSDPDWRTNKHPRNRTAWPKHKKEKFHLSSAAVEKL